MKLQLASLLALTFASQITLAGPTCTEDSKEKWQDKDAFQEKLKGEGYKIKVFKETKGNCYEIYGWNKEGQKVEIYFHPITGEKVKERID